MEERLRRFQEEGDMRRDEGLWDGSHGETKKLEGELGGMGAFLLKAEKS